MTTRFGWIVCLSALVATPAFAEEPKAVATEIAAARKTKDAAATSVAIKKSADAYKNSEDKSGRGALLGELGKVLKDKDMEAAHLAVVSSIVEIEDAKAGWKVLGRYLPHPKKTEEATSLEMAVVGAAGSLAPTNAIKPLTELAYKCKDPKAAAAAALALGGYGKNKKARVKLLVELITIGLRTRPGRSTDKNVSPVAQARWVAMGPSIIEGLNRLTGAKHQSFEAWESIYKDNKKKPAALFPADD